MAFGRKSSSALMIRPVPLHPGVRKTWNSFEEGFTIGMKIFTFFAKVMDIDADEENRKTADVINRLAGINRK
eukprot:g63443.t1